MKSLPCIALLAATLSGCATQEMTIVGPSATVRDSAQGIEYSRAELCFLSAIDGQEIRTSVDATLRNSGSGQLRATPISRKVPAKSFKATIQCRSVSVRPFDYTRKAGGIVVFEPKADMTYVVNGSISEEKVSVWIETADTRQKVTEEVTKDQ